MYLFELVLHFLWINTQWWNYWIIWEVEDQAPSSGVLHQRRRNQQKRLGSDHEEGENQRDGSVLEANGRKVNKEEGKRNCARAASSHVKRLRTSH